MVESTSTAIKIIAAICAMRLTFRLSIVVNHVCIAHVYTDDTPLSHSVPIQRSCINTKTLTVA